MASADVGKYLLLDDRVHSLTLQPANDGRSWSVGIVFLLPDSMIEGRHVDENKSGFETVGAAYRWARELVFVE